MMFAEMSSITMTTCVFGLLRSPSRIMGSLPAKQLLLIWTLLWSLTRASSQLNMSYYEEPTTTQLQKLIVISNTGDVIVGGRNVLLSVKSDMKKKQRIVTAPYDDHETDNDASILIRKKPYSSRGSFFLYCGTANQGSCSVHSLRNLTEKDELDRRNPLNHLGNKVSSVAFFGFAERFRENTTALYVGSTYDGRPLEVAPKAVSARMLSQDHRTQKYNISYLHYQSNGQFNHGSAIDIAENYKSTFPVRYIYGFEHDGFSYFLTVQKRYLDVYIKEYTTHLVRVCQRDPFFYSYTEIELNCKKAQFEPMYFNIAKAAYLGPVGEEMRSRSRFAEDEQVLYVAFGRNHSSEEGSGSDRAAVCMYSMTGIKADFFHVQHECYRGRGSHAAWIKPGMNNGCRANMDTLKHLNEGFCGSSENTAIAGRFPLETVANFTTEELLTTLRVVIHKTKTIAVMGTNSGSVLKVIINGNNDKPYATIPVMNDTKRSAPVTDMELSTDQRHAYVLTANRITKVPLEACSVHTTCVACVTSGDPLGCGWCEDRNNRGCSTMRDCRSPDRWYNASCPPIIHSFSPIAGPLEGGTRIEILGENFGTSNMTNDRPSVYVQQMKCSVVEFNWTRIVAVSSRSDVEMSAMIEVVADDPTRKPVVRGTGYSRTTFSSRNATIFDFSPEKGPESGGTLLTITGHNLHIGSRLIVLVDGQPCRVQDKAKNTIHCLTSKWVSSFQDRRRRRNYLPLATIEATVTVQMDNKYMEFAKKFTYANDPRIEDVYPRDSILSGGLRVTVKGQHLNTVRRPRLLAKVIGGNGHEYEGECEAEEDGSRMYCITPDLSIEPIYPDSPLSVDCSFHMDGVESLRDFATTHAQLSRFTYYVNPSFEQFKNGLRMFYLDDVMLHINGQDLDRVDLMKVYSVTVGDKPCNVTELSGRILFCRPEKPQEDANLDLTYPVKVQVAGLTFHIGDLQFALPTQNATIIQVSIILLFLLLVTAAITVCICYMKRNHKGIWKVKRTHDEPNVRYTAVAHLPSHAHPHERFYQMPPNDERIPNENTYWMNNSQALAAAQPSDTVLDDEARRLIDDANLLISRDNLLLMDVIGQGHFGCVYRGFLKKLGTKQDEEVAVKTLKSLTVGANHFHSMADQNQSYTASVECRKFLEEALRMREFEHPNILRLIGIALDKEKMPLVVLPFMKHGDLLSYIRNENNSPTVKELMSFAIQISEGMAYLANLKFVHRDLAARNCMLDDTMNVKVADFGLSRDIYERDYYSSDDPKAKLPVKWMAPESLEKGTYNTKTDVWSYGVVIWELMTRGVCPYPEVDNWDITKFLKEGRRMPQPSYCPDALYVIMVQCWDTEPKLRPSFQELVHNIRSIIVSMERAHEKVGHNLTYVNVPTSQPYLYPQSHHHEPQGAAGISSSAYPIATISNGNPSTYPHEDEGSGGARNGHRHSYHTAAVNARSQSTLV